MAMNRFSNFKLGMVL